MKAGWKTVKLGDVARIISGRNQREVESPNGPHPIIGSGGEMGRANETLCPAETTVVGRKGSINRPFFMKEPFWNVDTAFGISAEKNVITPKFLHYFCLSFDFTTLNKGTTIPSLVKSDIAVIDIPLPPLAEQKRIVALLDEAFAGIDEAKANAEELELAAKELKVSILGQLIETKEADMKIGWKFVQLEELIEIQNGYAFSSKEYSDSGHFLMRIGNVQNGYISPAEPKYVRLPENGSLDRFSLMKDDILVSLTGNVGRVGVVQKPHLPAALNQRVARISLRSNNLVMREYLLHFLYSDLFREKLESSGRGSAQQNVSTKDINAIEIPLPPLAEQKRIVARLDQAFTEIFELNVKVKAKFSGFSELKVSLLQRAFAGELTA